MKGIRTFLFWCHLATGATIGTVVFIMCATGLMLTYQRQIQYWADTRHYRADPPKAGSMPLPLSSLVAHVSDRAPDAAVTTVTFRRRPSDPAAVMAGTRTLYVNPYTGYVYGEGTGASVRAFFSAMTNWHRWLGRSVEHRNAARSVTAACNLGFLFLVVSGFFLWWPRVLTWVHIRRVFWWRRGLRPKAREFNWHHVIGVWSAIPLAIIVSSGVVMSYPWANNLVYRLAGEAPPAPGSGRGAAPRAAAESAGGRRGRADGRASNSLAGLDSLIERAEASHVDWQILTLRLPESSTAPVTFTVDRGDGGQPQLRATMTMDSGSGQIIRTEGFSDQTPGRRARSWLRFAHTGEAFGLGGQTVAGLASAGGTMLVYTGLSLAIRRWAARRRRDNYAHQRPTSDIAA